MRVSALCALDTARQVAVIVTHEFPVLILW